MLSFQKFCVYGVQDGQVQGWAKRVLKSLVTLCPLPFVQISLPLRTSFTEPPAVRASEERLSNGDIYLLENGLNLFLWVGASVQRCCPERLGVSSFSQITSGLVRAGASKESVGVEEASSKSRSQ